MNATIFRIFLLVFLFTTVAEAQLQLPLPLSSLPIGDNLHKNMKSVTLGLIAVDDQGRTDVPMSVKLPYTGASLEQWVIQQFKGLSIEPTPGWEHAHYLLGIQGDVLETYQGWDNTFTLERNQNRWQIPETAYNFKLKYVGIAIAIPATGFEVREGTRIFSTLTEHNDFETSCEIAAAEKGLAGGYVLLLRELSAPTEAERELTLWENDRFVTFDKNGTATEWSEISPSFFSPLPPIMLQKTSDGLELTVTGEGAIEESGDLQGWGPPHSLALLSESSPRRFRVAPSGTLKFYRLRPTVGAQTQ